MITTILGRAFGSKRWVLRDWFTYDEWLGATRDVQASDLILHGFEVKARPITLHARVQRWSSPGGRIWLWEKRRDVKRGPPWFL